MTFPVEEMVQVKAATKNVERPFSVDIGYDYEVTSVESYSMGVLPAKKLKSVQRDASKNLWQRFYRGFSASECEKKKICRCFVFFSRESLLVMWCMTAK